MVVAGYRGLVHVVRNPKAWSTHWETSCGLTRSTDAWRIYENVTPSCLRCMAQWGKRLT